MNDVNLVLMPVAEAKAVFESGTLDAWAVWGPWVEIEEVAGNGRALAGGEATIVSVATMPAAFIRDFPAAAQALVDAIIRAKRWCIEHPEDAAQTEAQELGFDLAAVQRAWPKFHWDTMINDSMIADFQAKAESIGGLIIDFR